MSTLYAKVLRDADLEAKFIGNKLEPRQFGFTSDTQSLVVRDELGDYHFIRQYDDTILMDLMAVFDRDLSAHIRNLEIHITDEERQVWDNKQDRILPGDNIHIDADGRTISATDTVYDDTGIQSRLDAEIAERGEADAELQAQIDTLMGAIIFIGRIDLPNSEVTQAALTARAQELGKYPLVKGYCLIDNDNDDWVWDGESEWIDIGFFDVAQATNTSLGVVKGSSDTLKIGVDGSGEMSVNGLQDAPANTVFAGPVSGGNAQPAFRPLTLDDLPQGIGGAESARPNTMFYLGQLENENPSQQALNTFGATQAQSLYESSTLLTGYTVRDALDRDWRYVAEGETIIGGGGGETIPAYNGLMSVTTVTGVTYNKVIYANSMFVAVGNNGVIETSPSDLSTFVRRSSGTTADLWDIVYTHNFFVAVGGAATIVTSPDGINWTPTQVSGAAASGTNIIFTGIASDGTNIYVVGKERGVLVYATSPTGSWSVSSSTTLLGSSDQERHIAYGNSRWLVAVRRTTGAQALLYEITSPSQATSGSNWTLTTGGKPSRIRFINNAFWLITGGNGTNDGRIYNLGNNPSISTNYAGTEMTPVGNVSLWDIAPYLNNGVMAVGDGGTSIYTTDGINWQPIADQTLNNANLKSGAVNTNDKIVLMGYEYIFVLQHFPEVSIGGGGEGEVVVTDGYWYLVGGESEAVSGDISWNDITDKPTIPVGANLTEQAATFGQSARSGSANTWARSDHYHALPSAPTVPTGANIDAAPLNTAVAHGSAQTWSRSDHRHAIPAIPADHSGQSLNFRVGSTANQLSFGVNDSTTKSLRFNAGSNVTLTVGGDSTDREITIASAASVGGSTAEIPHGFSTTGAGTAEKAVTLANFTLTSGAIIAVTFTTANTASSPTLNVNSGTAYAMNYQGVAVTASMLPANHRALFQYGIRTSGSSTNYWTLLNPYIAGGGGVSVDDLSNQGTAAFGQTAQNGSAATAARSDHVHALPSAPSVPTGANLSSQAASFGQSAQNGSAATWARSDHYHALPSAPSVPTGANLSSQAASFGQSAQNGSATTFARSDHYHALPATPTASIWSGSNTGGNCNSQTTPGNFSGSWTSNTPTGGTLYGSLLVLASDVSTSYRQQVFIAESSAQMWFRNTTTGTWVALSSGGGIAEPTNDSLTYGRRVTSGSGAWRRAVDLAGDTMTGILNIERSANTVSDANSYLRIRTTSGSIDGMRMGAASSGISTCGGWIQGFYANGTAGGLTLNPSGGYVDVGSNMSLIGSNASLLVANRVNVTNNGITANGVQYEADMSSRLSFDALWFFKKFNGTWDSPGTGAWRFVHGGTGSSSYLNIEVYNGSTWVQRARFNYSGSNSV